MFPMAYSKLHSICHANYWQQCETSRDENSIVYLRKLDVRLSDWFRHCGHASKLVFSCKPSQKFQLGAE